MQISYETLILLHKHILKANKIKEIVRNAIQDTLLDWTNDNMRQETDITNSIGNRIQDGLNGIEDGNVNFKSMFIPDHGPGSMEKKLGADLAGLMTVNLQNYSIKKLFLAQAKIIKGDKVERKHLGNLIKQSTGMLSVTPFSIVMLYSREGVYAVPAADVRDLSLHYLKKSRGTINFKDDLYYMPLEHYVEDVYTTWQGDREKGAHISNIGDLENVMLEVRARAGLSITISEKNIGQK